MSVTSIIETVIYSYDRLSNTRMGGPRFLLHTAAGDFRTKADAGDAYIVCPYIQGKRVRLSVQEFRGQPQVYGISLIGE